MDKSKLPNIKKMLLIAIILIAIISLLVFLFLKPSAEEKEKRQVLDDSHASFQQSLSEQYGEEQAQEILNKELSDEQLLLHNSAHLFGFSQCIWCKIL